VVDQFAPAIEIPGLDGGTRATLSPAGERDTVIFIRNLGCGFYRRLAPDILAWEQVMGAGYKRDAYPRSLVVATGNTAFSSHRSAVGGPPVLGLSDREGEPPREGAEGARSLDPRPS